jgi:hypothetical protein
LIILNASIVESKTPGDDTLIGLENVEEDSNRNVPGKSEELETTREIPTERRVVELEPDLAGIAGWRRRGIEVSLDIFEQSGEVCHPTGQYVHGLRWFEGTHVFVCQIDLYRH